MTKSVASGRVSDHELLLRLKKGDKEAFDELYIRHMKDFFLHAVGRGLSNNEAEDVVQTAFLKALKGIDSYEEHRRGGRSWIKMILNNEINNIFRRISREQNLIVSYACRLKKDSLIREDQIEQRKKN